MSQSTVEGGVVVTEQDKTLQQSIIFGGKHQILAAFGSCTSMTLRIYVNHKKIPLEITVIILNHKKIHAEDCKDC